MTCIISQWDHDECLRKISWGIFVSAITGAITAYIGRNRHFEVEKYQKGVGAVMAEFENEEFDFQFSIYFLAALPPHSIPQESFA